MRKYITMALIATAMCAQAQDKKLDKVKQLYEAQSYTECIEAAKKYNQANNTKAESYMYLGLSYYSLYLENPKKEMNLTQAENNVYGAVRKDKDQTVCKNFSPEMEKLHQSVTEAQDKCWEEKDKVRAQQHSNMLVKIWSDTTEIWRRINQPELFVQPVTYGKQLAAWTGPTNEYDVTGDKVGVWIDTYPNGKRKTQVSYQKGKPRGDYYRFYENGGVSAHLYMIDDDRASAILYNENGDKVAMGYYYKRQKDSLWQYLAYDSVLVAEENWTRGIKNGKETTYFLWGLPADETMWKNGKKNGIWRRYHESSNLLIEGYYVDGMLNGQYSLYTPDGQLEMQGNYKNDLRVGKWKVYDKKAKKWIERNYIDGKLENQEEQDKEETKRMEELMQKASDLPDPKDYSSNPEEYFEMKR